MSRETLALSLRKRAGEFDLEVEADFALTGVTAIIGPSGAGKSLLLRLIAGFERPDAGSVVLGGEVWADTAAKRHVPAWRRGAGFLFQDVRLFAHLGVAGNLDFAARRAPSGGPRMAAVVEALDLGALLERNVTTLSGGERQRVALARTLLTAPRLLLLDEPLSALDRTRKRAILPYLETAIRGFGIPALYVSHDLDEVALLADRIAVVEAGRLTAHGPAADVLEGEAPPLGAERRGAGALLSGRVVDRDERLLLTRIDLGGAQLAMPLERVLAPGETVRVYIRARDVVLARTPPQDISLRNTLPVTIAAIEAPADSPFALVGLKLGETRLYARITRAAAEELALAPGQRVFALVKSVSFDGRV